MRHFPVNYNNVCSTKYAARVDRGNKRCFCPSARLPVCLSVAYIANISRTQRPSVTWACPNLEGKCTLDATCIPVSTSKGQRSGRIARPINADTHHTPIAWKYLISNFPPSAADLFRLPPHRSGTHYQTQSFRHQHCGRSSTNWKLFFLFQRSFIY